MTLLPNFVIIGAMKSGTTSLYDSLRISSGFFLPDNKEPNLLHRATSVDDCRKAYQRHFRGAGDGMILGEASTIYTMMPWFPDLSKRARDVCGSELRLIMIMRDPIDRIVSHLRHDYLTGRLSTADFDVQVLAEQRFVAISDYATQLEPWVKTFGADRLLCVDFEKVRCAPGAQLERVAAFLGCDPRGMASILPWSNSHDALLAPRIRGLINLAGSGAYFNGLRRALPSSVRRLAKQALFQRREVVEVALSASTIERLEAQLRSVRRRLFDLTGFSLSERLISQEEI